MRKPKRPNEEDIFKKGSTTYYWSSKFFPHEVREDVFKLYSFVRVVDDCVDQMPAQGERFQALKTAWEVAKADKHFDTVRRSYDTLDERVIKNIVDVVRNYHCEPAWIDAFLASMQADLDGKTYETLDDTLDYIYGSAEVIGLLMSKIMGLPDEALPYACLQGRAMQYINFIRDIAEDNELGRSYFPGIELATYGLKDLTATSAKHNPDSFERFIRAQLERYAEWQAEAELGFHYIPRHLLRPLKTAVAMYDWTAAEIARDPAVVYKRKVKPTKSRVVRTALSRL